MTAVSSFAAWGTGDWPDVIVILDLQAVHHLFVGHLQLEGTLGATFDPRVDNIVLALDELCQTHVPHHNQGNRWQAVPEKR